MTKAKTMLHPFTGNTCEVIDLKPGDCVQEGDLYRSATISEKGLAMGAEAPGIGRWFAAGAILDGKTIGPDCNVHFLRLVPEAVVTETQRTPALTLHQS